MLSGAISYEYRPFHTGIIPHILVNYNSFVIFAIKRCARADTRNGKLKIMVKIVSDFFHFISPAGGVPLTRVPYVRKSQAIFLDAHAVQGFKKNVQDAGRRGRPPLLLTIK